MAVIHTIVVTNDGHGSTTPDGETEVTVGNPLSILATPSEGYQFTEWIIDSGDVTILDSTEADTTATLNTTGSATIEATFEVIHKTKLATAAGVRSECNLPETVKDTMLVAHITSASIEMKRLLDAGEEEVYAAVLAEAETEDRSIACTKAENLLAFAYAIPFLNIETSGRGIVSSKGWDQSRSELMSQNQVDQMVEKIREQAMNLLMPYLPVVDDDTEDEQENPIVNAGGITMIAI